MARRRSRSKPIQIQVIVGGKRAGTRRRKRRSSGGNMAALGRAIARGMRGNDRPAAQGPAGSPQHVFFDGWGRPHRFRS